MIGRRRLQLYGGLLVAIITLALAVDSAVRDGYLEVFGWVVASWGSYLVAHHGATGRFVDEPGTGDAPAVPQSLPRRAILVAAILGMVVAFPLGIFALANDSFGVLLTAATLFVGAYVAGHHLLTGQPL
ncbi:hypothetical protein [Haloplanus aerogenes]|uniref:Uncharacterized protein n=1 Tax=Haloplanus aerogenes TaxID=660522 RepID=A0A3M0DUF5_9EURY|nr:hypothetical protein [Haloplanus aerogenes]AZH25794.1 hypothetical protein DU502_10570 [Haloplanus aerogenes]RMB25532.1 hypothetical protein ATH50_0629 [Haloplanus aerogenes]